MVCSAAMRVAMVLLCALLWASAALAQAPEPGRRQFETLCASCHGGDGNGGEHGPAIVTRLALRRDDELAAFIHDGLPGAGMPGFPLPDPDMHSLIAFLRTLRSKEGSRPPRVSVKTTEGRTLTGVAVNRSSYDLQLLDDNHRVQLLRKEGERYRRVTSDASRLAVTPLVVDGIMYVTTANECHALDAGSGRRIWSYRRTRTKGLAGDAAGGTNRGVALAGDLVFMVTDHAHIFALDRFTGALRWDTEMADWHQNYGATSAPLAVGRLVISGTSGGDEGARGFLAAFDQATGKEVWRFWTVPKHGEPGSETWQGKDIEHGCATTWFTGTYDADLGTLYWPTGNPCPDYDGSERGGDNLYSDSMLALDPQTGRLKWHFQYTPHDIWDWDAHQPVVLADAEWQGRPRKLLLHANRNGFFYLLDRTNGQLLLAKPFVKKLTWAREIGPDGRPVLIPDQDPTPEGRTVCPSVEGATNWFSTSFDRATGLYYVQTLEKCTIYTKTNGEWQPGKSYYHGTTKDTDEAGQKVLRAIDFKTGRIVWELPQTGEADSWGGVLGTAGGLLFLAEDGGALMAVDAAAGRPLWHFQASAHWKSSPMTYMFDGTQYVAVAAGPSIIAFALVE